MRLGAVTVSSVGSHHAKQNAPVAAKFLRSSASLAARFRFQSASGNACAVNLKDSNTSTATAMIESRLSQASQCLAVRTQMIVRVGIVVRSSSTDRALTGYYSAERWRLLFVQPLNSRARSTLLFPAN